MDDEFSLLGEMNSEVLPPSCESELRIILVGKTGAGKSATGNTILGKSKIFKSKMSPKAVTEECKEGSVERGGRRILVVDTPGIFGSLNQEQMKKQIDLCVQMSVPGPHAFLLVIGIGRFTEEEKNAVKWIQDNFGEDAAKYTIILFTHEDQLESTPLSEFINESEDLQDLIKKCHQRYHSFDNKNCSTVGNVHLTQVPELLEVIDAMVEGNGGQHYTSEMFEKVQQKIRMKKIAKDAALGAATAVGVGGAVAGGVVLGVTEIAALPVLAAVAAVGGATAGGILAIGAGAKFVVDKCKKKKNSVSVK